MNAPVPDPTLSGETAPTPAVTRAAEALATDQEHIPWAGHRHPDNWREHANAALAAALDVEEMARAIDPRAFGDDLGDEHFSTRRNVATLAAQRIRAALLGTTP